MDNLDLTAVARMAFILAHLLAFALSAVGVAFADYAILRQPSVDAALLRSASHVVALSLFVLWVTGLGLVWIDTAFTLAEIRDRPKLLAKLCVVIGLSVNGWLLHRLVFPRFLEGHEDAHSAATLPAILGAVSASSWLFAAFVGVGRAVTPALGLPGFLALYAAVVSLAVVVSLVLVKPRLVARMGLPEPARPGVQRDVATAQLGPLAADPEARHCKQLG